MSLRCVYCGIFVEHIPNAKGITTPDFALTRDHVIPRSKGGKGQSTVVCCKGCNDSKFNLSLQEWRIVLSLRHKHIHIFWWEKQWWSRMLGAIPASWWIPISGF